MKKLCLFCLVIFITFLIKYSFAGTKTGTSMAQFLKIGVGARAVGMGEAFVALSNDALALYWNPAGISFIGKVNLTTTHTEWFADLTHDFAGVTVPVGNGALGASITFFNSDEIEITTLEQPDGTGIYYDASDLAIAISYALKITNRFSVGITGKYLQQNLYHESAEGFAIDVGTLLYTGFRGLRIGMSLSNFGMGMKFEGRDLIVPHDPGGSIANTPNIQAEMTTETWPLPTNFRVGIAVDIVNGQDSFIKSETTRLTLAIDGNRPTDNEERANIGLEYAWNDRIALRIGYKFNFDVEDLTLGGGYNLNLGEANLEIDYRSQSRNRLCLG
jgi:hypothetical protein